MYKRKNLPGKKVLIVNADDFGVTRGVNAAIADCNRYGVLRSATLMANGAAFEDAVAVAKKQENLGVGIHFVLTGLKPLSSPSNIPELAGPDGLLPSGPAELLKLTLSRRAAREEIRKELFTQAERVFDSGIIPTHFDSHKHVHVIPAVLEIMVDIASRFSVRWIRDPFEGPGALRFLFDVEKGKRGKFLKQYAAGQIVRSARPRFRSIIRTARISCPGSFHGVSSTGLLTEGIVARLSRSLDYGINELMTHPGYLDEDLKGQKTRLLASRERERDILASSDLKRLFDKNEIVLSHFGEVNP